MARSNAFRDLVRIARIACLCDRRGLTTDQGFAQFTQAVERRSAAMKTRREALAGLGAAAAMGPVPRRKALAKRPPNADIAIVGGGIAGLTCADTLRAAGVNATLYEARDRL